MLKQYKSQSRSDSVVNNSKWRIYSIRVVYSGNQILLDTHLPSLLYSITYFTVVSRHSLTNTFEQSAKIAAVGTLSHLNNPLIKLAYQPSI